MGQRTSADDASSRVVAADRPHRFSIVGSIRPASARRKPTRRWSPSRSSRTATTGPDCASSKAVSAKWRWPRTTSRSSSKSTVTAHLGVAESSDRQARPLRPEAFAPRRATLDDRHRTGIDVHVVHDLAASTFRKPVVARVDPTADSREVSLRDHRGNSWEHFDEPRGCEVLIEREGLAQPAIPHDAEARRVDERKDALIVSSEPRPGSCLLFLVDGMNREVLVARQRLHPVEKRDCRRVTVLPSQERPRLGTDEVRRERLFCAPETSDERERGKGCRASSGNAHATHQLVSANFTRRRRRRRSRPARRKTTRGKTGPRPPRIGPGPPVAAGNTASRPRLISSDFEIPRRRASAAARSSSSSRIVIVTAFTPNMTDSRCYAYYIVRFALRRPTSARQRSSQERGTRPGHHVGLCESRVRLFDGEQTAVEAVLHDPLEVCRVELQGRYRSRSAAPSVKGCRGRSSDPSRERRRSERALLSAQPRTFRR